MRTILFILFTFLTITLLGQNVIQKDTTITCIPNNVARQILKDLNELDKLKKNEILYVDEINELSKKTVKQDSIISKLEEKDKLSSSIIKGTEEKVNLIEKDNENLRKEIKRINLKTNIIEIVSGAILATITYIQLFK
jgi:type II secretory pathway predicted ATPase ExeA